MAEDKGQSKSDTAHREEEVLKFWQENKVFEESLKKPAPKGEFVFYDGPPFATGLPHHGHLLGSTSKDLFGRYRTMRGYHVRRRWGWDTHGLPIETLAERKLGLKNKREILEIGVKRFNQEARSMVLEFVSAWKAYVERLGRWVDFDNSYKTMDPSYTESVWWALKEIHKRGHLYEGRKVLMYCPHCETPLAKAEIAMDNTYKDITEEAVYVKFRVLNPEAVGISTPLFFVAWTTTPWTLPANTALAVGPDIEYVYVPHGEETLIVAKGRAEALGLTAGGKPVEGRIFHGLRYEPIYLPEKARTHTGKKWQVFAEDFVTAEDGTGVVHTGTIYGEDDYTLILKEGLPPLQLLNANATYNDDAPEFLRGQYVKKAEESIKADLELRGVLFKKEIHTHSYPHCHRCGTPLIYNAVSSWFIDVQRIKDKMLAENEKITWVPGHLKHGRFQKIVESAPDWTISRNRFWASPLPIWKDKEGNVTVVGSLDELKSLTKKSGNRYFVARHGQSTKNIPSDVIRCVLSEDDVHLTEVGKQEAAAMAQQLRDKSVDIIFTSPYVRTKETAEVIRSVLGLHSQSVVIDERLREFDHGKFNRTPSKEFERYFGTALPLLDKAPEGGMETFTDMKRRVGEFIYELESKYQNKNIVVVSHGWPIAPLIAAAGGYDRERTAHAAWEEMPEPGVLTELPFVPLPHNDDYELDYHLPYIDEVQLEKDGQPLIRIPEVVDSWVEAGAMPFAEYHYPFENRDQFERRTPGDFISEYIAQTRTWFYYLHVLGILLFNHRAFTNVVTTGTILAADGEKMSKSKKNFTDPAVLMDQYGSDALRYYLMSSVVMQAEDFNFRDDELKDVHNKVVNIYRNVKSFFELYEDTAPAASDTSPHVLDRWILTRLNTLMSEVTQEFDRFDTVRGSRPMREFIDDLSTWYVRRSRERAKSDDKVDKERALGTLRYVLREFSKIIAPVMPFIADEVYRAVRAEGEPISVHLTDWPEKKSGGVLSWFSRKESLIEDMEEVRALVSVALEARQKANIKVRQPLGLLKVNSKILHGKDDLLALIRDEVNVKSVVVQEGIEGRVMLDTTLTPELVEEGELRDLIREIQDLRKKSGLNPKDLAMLTVPADKKAFVDKHWDVISKSTNLRGAEVGEPLEVRK